ncbi:MAG: hypothetical protein LBQ77_05960 [Treponema sp.]|nr:hypothetical protein [Treponema sp.]
MNYNHIQTFPLDNIINKSSPHSYLRKRDALFIMPIIVTGTGIPSIGEAITTVSAV